MELADSAAVRPAWTLTWLKSAPKRGSKYSLAARSRGCPAPKEETKLSGTAESEEIVDSGFLWIFRFSSEAHLGQRLARLTVLFLLLPRHIPESREHTPAE